MITLANATFSKVNEFPERWEGLGEPRHAGHEHQRGFKYELLSAWGAGDGACSGLR